MKQGFDTDTAHKLIRARSDLVLEHPFFASLALRLDFREDTSCRTAWVDGSTFAYNPAYMGILPLAKIKGVLCHEVLHLACCHHTRRGGRDARLWNMACDYAINPVLLDAGLELPDGYLDDDRHRGKTADAIYATMVHASDEIKGGSALDNGKASDADEEDAQVSANHHDKQEEGGGAGSPPRDVPPPEELPESPARRDATGSGTPGESLEENDSDPGMTGEVRDADTSPGKAEDGEGAGELLAQQEQQWQAAMAQALRKAKEFGDIPGSLERLCNSLLAPVLSWRELLRRFLQHRVRNDFTWVRPNRRHLHAGIYLPGLESEELEQIAVAVDVSGSITQPQLDAFMAELSAILEEFDSTLTLITCDTEVTSERQLTRADLPLSMHARGGGGTDFRPPFERIAHASTLPSCLIYLTDMECDRFPAEPEYPVLWVCPCATASPPPFGEVVHMESL
ncbi:MAG: DUF2201 family putative metallopeptidase [Halodesulfovibrio sp.]